MENVERKMARIQNGEKPRVLDLFAGCGGISLGFLSAGYEIIGAIEIDKDAAKTHAINFHKGCSEESINIHSKNLDITSLTPSDFVKNIGYSGDKSTLVDVIVGGPPCQAFARVGRAKLREVAEHPEAYLNDPRGNLYLRYLEYVRELNPVAILIENVPDVLNYGGHNISEEICEVLDTLGYDCRYTLLNSVYYGVPQMRERMFLLAYHKSLNVEIKFPKPSHWIELPIGYHNSRQVALKTVNFDLFSNLDHYYTQPPKSSNLLNHAITAEDAISDLPQITGHLKGQLTRGARRFTELTEYPNTNTLNSYVTLMRTWKGFENNIGVKDHVIRSLPRDYKIFAKMQPGNQYPEAHKIANELFQKEIKKLLRKGILLKANSAAYNKLKSQFVPPYNPGKFPNKWRKMESNMPSRTLLAHLGKDSYSHIHYDSKQARTISVREAARLQSFPDGFIFSGTMNPAFKQIGNSVPPLMAKAIADVMYKTLNQVDNAQKISYQKTNPI
jgi:DNA (cytosine-5)-methyltransferase 1